MLFKRVEFSLGCMISDLLLIVHLVISTSDALRCYRNSASFLNLLSWHPCRCWKKFSWSTCFLFSGLSWVFNLAMNEEIVLKGIFRSLNLYVTVSIFRKKNNLGLFWWICQFFTLSHVWTLHNDSSNCRMFSKLKQC